MGDQPAEAATVSGPGDVAIVHDYLTQRGGAERVVLAMHRAFPSAPIHTSLYDPAATFPELSRCDVRPFPLDHLRALRRRHRLALPLLAPAFSAARVDAEVVLCSSSGWAHGVRTSGRKVVYCHAPARWLYQPDVYLADRGRGTAALVTGLRPLLTRWDRRAAATADRYLANSERTRRMVRDAYGVDAEVVHPPHGVDPDGPQAAVAGLGDGFALCVSRLMAYKNVDAVVAAFDRLPAHHLVVVGSGPAEAALRRSAPANVSFRPRVGDDELRWLYAHASVLVGASYEDYGLTPLEAAAFGTPAAVLRFGGYLETVVEAVTGVFFDHPTPEAIAAAVTEVDRSSLDPTTIARHAERFSEATFAAQLRQACGC